MAMAEETELCFFQMPDGSVECRSCDSPPIGGEFLEVAPPGTPMGKVREWPIPPHEG